MVRELLVATVLVFALGVTMMVASPTIDGLADRLTGQDTVGEKSVGYDVDSKINQVRHIALVLMPTMAGIGIVIYAYAATARRESFRGRL
jgi:hypothetical protein